VAADLLAGKGHRVTVREVPGRGGLVGTFTVNGVIERFYHHLFTSDVDYVDFAQELGLDGDISGCRRR
jgi:protoporphyrinogen oxidase